MTLNYQSASETMGSPFPWLPTNTVHNYQLTQSVTKVTATTVLGIVATLLEVHVQGVHTPHIQVRNMPDKQLFNSQEGLPPP